MSKGLLRQYITEVMAGFDNKNAGKDGIGGNLHYMGSTQGDAGVRANTNVLDDEANEEQQEKQDEKGAACCLVMGEDGTVLAVSRKDDPTMWGMPGGKIDPGEDAETAAARELQEETGLTAKDLHLVFKRKDAQGYTTYTFATEVEGHIDTPESGVIRWVHPDVLLDPSSSPYVEYNAALFKRVGVLQKHGPSPT